ncbi:DgyrCDS12710 [Dimorphilus gyrociliatus]|uniref:DgyrCDS12710 n=1 Tax=Dimorphilus gyrociliatus TaxID=2664684 RepID=A0A7I8W7A5_9ANNE|nr:DgyrCDS12710 [Dimorphilus gyrociliatus]
MAIHQILLIYETSFLWRAIKNADREALELKPAKRLSVAVATDLQDDSLHYGIVIDCGSSGSRVYVYYWPRHDPSSEDLLQIKHVIDKDLKPVIKKVTPGISSFGDKPAEASDHLKPLLSYAASYVPQHKHKETPLYIMATAGMRMLNEKQQASILDDLRVDVPLEFQFLFHSNHVEVISGKQEGVFAWIALNFALGKLDHSIGDDPLVAVESSSKTGKLHVRKRTVGVLDMGGGSLQVAFEVPQFIKFQTREELPKSLMAEINLGCTTGDVKHTYRVYVTTYLGFGANAARKTYEEAMFLKNKHLSTVFDPCLPVSMKQNISGLLFIGSGKYEECYENVKILINETAPCPKKPCAINGTFQPNIAFKNSEFYGFSEFYYTMEDVLRMGGRYLYSSFSRTASDYCGTSYEVLSDLFKKNRYPKADENRLKFQCFKSAWVAAVLHNGLGFPKDYKSLTSLQSLGNQEIHWTLGALLFKTRFYPLRDKDSIGSATKLSSVRSWLPLTTHAHYIIAGCVLIVGMSIVVYLRSIVPRRVEKNFSYA